MPGRSSVQVRESSCRRAPPSDDAPMSSGGPAVSPVGKIPGRIAGRAGAGIFDSLERQSGRHQTQVNRRREIEVYGVRVTRQGFVGKSLGHFLSNLVAASPNAGAQVRASRRGTDVSGGADRPESRFRHAREDASPARMRGGHGVPCHEENRQTISAGHGERQVRRTGHRRVAFGLESRRVHGDDAGSMNLTERDDVIRREADAVQQPPSILRHRFGVVRRGAAEVQGVEGRPTDATLACGECRPHARALGGAVMAPQGNRGFRIEAPHADDHRNRVGERQGSPAFHMGDSR